jgi:tRNA uridine 5-carboxymethylaminomethyl modification enzyme
MSAELGSHRREVFAQRRRDIEMIEARLAAATYAGEPVPRWLKRPEFTEDMLAGAVGGLSSTALATVYADHRYADYIVRQSSQIRRQRELEHRRFPPLDFAAIPGLRAEAAQALARFTPATYGQAGRLEGVTPADLSLIAVHAKRLGGTGGSAA